MSPTPPRPAVRLLAAALRHDPAGTSILGDLQEDFARMARSRGAARATRWYWREALLLASGHFARSVFRPRYGNPPMNASTSALRHVLQDAVYAMRTLRRHAGFSLFTAVIVGVGVGATTVVFSVLRPLMLSPLPFEAPEELVWIANESAGGDNSLTSVTSRSSNLRDFRERTSLFQGLTGYNAFFDQGAYTLTSLGEPERVAGIGVAYDFLDVLGVEPLHGRSFTREEGAWGGPRAILLSHEFWRRRFEEDPRVVGQSLTINEIPRTIVGVLPPSFDLTSVFRPGQKMDFLAPLPISPETDQWGNTLAIIGRLRPGVSSEAAQAELDMVIATLQEVEPDRWGLGAHVTLLQEHVAAPFRPALLLLAAAAATVLLIVCVNVSNLLLSRSPGRAHEGAVRQAFGASRGRLVRQLMLETVGIFLFGGAIGAGLAWIATRWLVVSEVVALPLLNHVRVDGVALLVGTVVALVAGMLVGLIPTLQVTEGRHAHAMRRSGRGTGPGGRGARRLRESLVVAEVTLAFALLVIGGLFLRSFHAVVDVDLGFDAQGVVTWQLSPRARGASPQERGDSYAALTRAVEQVLGVQQVGLVDALPLGQTRSWGFTVVGVDDAANEQLYPHIADPGYLPAMRIPLASGRNFTSGDTHVSPPVILMNESGARRVFGDDPLGGRIRVGGTAEWEVVGVVRDVRHISPEMDAGLQVYFPVTQMSGLPTVDLVVRSALPVDQVAPGVRAALAEIDPTMATQEFSTLQSRVGRAFATRGFILRILGAYAAVALLLAALGIYGVLAHSVAERRAEIGVRRALGASAPDLVWGIMRRTLLLAGAGVVAGAAISLAGLSLVRSFLYGVSATDPLTFASIASILLLVAAVAAAVPAARAARMRDIRVLSGE